MKIKLLLLISSFMLITTFSWSQEITIEKYPLQWEYFNGDQKLKNAQIGALLKQDAEAYAIWQKSRKHNTLGWVFLGLEVGAAVWLINTVSNEGVYGPPLLALVGTGATAIIFSISSKRKKKEAILKYNEKYDLGYLQLAPSSNGVGLIYNF